VFRGINAVNMDAKGRLSMPTRYRDRLHNESASQLILTIDTEEPCLLLYPLPSWEIIEAKLAKLPSFDPTSRRIQRLLIGHATDSEIDAQGRISVPPLLRDYAHLERKVILLGQGNKFELWAAATWQARRDQWLEEGDNSGDISGDLELLSL
jgi:MraZ protein